LKAQGTSAAMSFSLPGNTGYVFGGVGWTFVPTSNLVVTGISSTAGKVSFWLGTNQVFASYDYSGGYPSFPFQSIAPLLLFAGQSYAISAQNTNFTSEVVFMVFGPPSSNVYDPPPFGISSYISQFASYSLSTNAQWGSPLVSPPANTNYLFFGPNFQFQVVPSLTVGQSSNSVTVSWPYPSTGWTLQQSAGAADASGWQTSGYTSTTNGSVESITITAPTENLFFRLAK
jgi:hypothetical protein